MEFDEMVSQHIDRERLVADMEHAGVKPDTPVYISSSGLIYAKTNFDPWGVRPLIRENGVFRDATPDEIARDMKENGVPSVCATAQDAAMAEMEMAKKRKSMKSRVTVLEAGLKMSPVTSTCQNCKYWMRNGLDGQTPNRMEFTKHGQCKNKTVLDMVDGYGALFEPKEDFGCNQFEEKIQQE